MSPSIVVLYGPVENSRNPRYVAGRSYVTTVVTIIISLLGSLGKLAVAGAASQTFRERSIDDPRRLGV